jgi:hypothetical protein
VTLAPHASAATGGADGGPGGADGAGGASVGGGGGVQRALNWVANEEVAMTRI